MKAFTKTLCALLALVIAAGCGTASPSAPQSPPAATPSSAAVQSEAATLTFTDALGYEVSIKSHDRVVSLYGSFAETWVLAGGTLAGTTNDAIKERKLELSDDVAIVGTTKEPNMEEILALNPDFVILSADTSEQVDMHNALSTAKIPHAYYRVDTFSDYLAMLKQLCGMTGREDLYQKNGAEVQAQIDKVMEAVKKHTEKTPTALLIRAFSSGAKAKGDDNLAGVMLRDLGAENLVSKHESLLEDVSMEEIISADPDFIFVVTMGASEEKALGYMAESFLSNPAWAGLSAVKNDRYIILPKNLFHYKPNAKWGESYAYLAKILYPSIAAEIK